MSDVSLRGLPAHWRQAVLGDLAEVRGGKRLPKGIPLTSSPTSHPYLRVVDFQGGRVGRRDLMYVPDDVFPMISRYTISSRDVYVSIVGTVGLVGTIAEDLDGASLTENAAKICNLGPDIDRDFLAYYLSSEVGQHEIRAQTVGSTQPKLALFRIKSIHVPVPPIAEQRAIAATLRRLDDKIELNLRMNDTLESIACAIFKSWFVDFDPVRAKEDGRWQEGQSLPGLPKHLYDLFPSRLVGFGEGEIPDGWQVGTLGDLSHKPQYGYTASAKSEPVGPKFLRITDINKTAWIEWGSVPYCEMEDGDREKYRLHKGDVLIARMADPGHGVTIEDDQDAVFASYLIRFRLKNVEYSRFLQYWLRSRSYWEMVKGGGAGTTRVSLNAQVLGSFPLVIPPRSVASAFTELVGCLRVRVVANASETQLLAAARDALLPKLISGERHVRDAKRTVGGVGA